jgi:hypothetical protein
MKVEDRFSTKTFYFWLAIVIIISVMVLYSLSKDIVRVANQKDIERQCKTCLALWQNKTTTNDCEKNCLCTTQTEPYYQIRFVDPASANISIAEFNKVCYPDNITDEYVSCEKDSNTTGRITITQTQLNLEYELVNVRCVNVSAK